MTSTATPGRPRAGIDAVAFAATLRTVNALGYTGATMDRTPRDGPALPRRR